jgi:YbbR domain-containing protein
MKQIRVKKIFLFVKRKVKNFSYHKAMVFLVCLALSSFLWLLNSLEKRYTSRIIVPVRYVEFPNDKQLTGILPQNFDLMVDAYGYTLLSYKLRLAFSPIQINVGEMIDNALERGSKFRYSVATVAHKEEIEKQISSEIRILSIKPDSLVFNFNKIISKKIKVKPDLKLNFESEYSLENKPLATPDSILVSGPKNILDTLKFVSTIYRNHSGLSHSVEETVPLHAIPGIKFGTREVQISIPVEQTTEVTFEVPVTVINKPADIILKTFPGKIKVSCRIGLSKYKKLDYNSFRATINYEKVSLNDPRLPVTFESLAKIEMSAGYSPKEVEFIVEHAK